MVIYSGLLFEPPYSLIMLKVPLNSN